MTAFFKFIRALLLTSLVMRIRAFSFLAQKSRTSSTPTAALAKKWSLPDLTRFQNYPRNPAGDFIGQRLIHVGLHSFQGEQGNEEGGPRQSVTGPVYDVENEKIRDDFPVVQLYTKEGCTLCDKVSDVLRLIRDDYPHSLEAIDITDEDKGDIFDRYKWDIPVLKINGIYWTKHRLDVTEAVKALTSAQTGEFAECKGEPDAAAMERKMAERCEKQAEKGV
mmetsp:Transcript_6057/g.8913  ORF Transcript_6057/g.8913 Transcript_6057/m.8913 type:complete len:221 (-) Transcript_6057:95-757(-)